MKKRYFDEDEFSYSMRLFETDPYATKERLLDYLKKYPKDYYARAYYVILLTYICEIDEAKKEYKRIIEESKNDNFFNYISKSPKKFSAFRFNMVIGKIKILSACEKYQELYDFFLDNYMYLMIDDQNYVSYYCQYKLGLLDVSQVNSKSYRLKQIVNYSEARFLEHIQDHLDNDLDKESAIFRANFPLNSIIQEVKKFIPSDKKLCRGFFDDTYCFKYDNCGLVNGSQTNYFKVVCFHNTSNFITMYPSKNCEHLSWVDLNYLIEKDDSIKVKKLSQVDKFYKRYNRS